VGETDRVDHPGGRLPQARRRVALARSERDRLRDEGVEGKLVEKRIAEGAAGGDRVVRAGAVKDRAAKGDAAQVDGLAQCPVPAIRAVSSWSASSTGPSTHSRT